MLCVGNRFTVTKHAETDQRPTSNNKSKICNMFLAENLQKIVCNGLLSCNDFHLNVVSLKIAMCDITLNADCKRCAANQWEACNIPGAWLLNRSPVPAMVLKSSRSGLLTVYKQ